MWRWLNERVHVSWLIAAGCAGFVAGVASVLIVEGVGSWWLIFAVAPSFAIRRRWVVPLMFVTMAVVGNGYGSQTYAEQSMLGALHGQYVELSGMVREDPATGDKGDMRLQLQDISAEGKDFEGAVWVSIVTGPEVLRGDTVIVRGVLDEGFGTFVGMMSRASVVNVVRPVPGDVGRVVRDWFATAVRQGIPEPQASLGVGFLTGQKSALPLDLAEALKIAGLTHIVVASGYNLTILVRLARRLFVKSSKYLSILTSSVMIAGFVGVTGLSPSMTRAGIVSGLSLLTWAYGRSCHPFVLLALVAAVTVWWQPSYAWGDLGWQLSFAAFFGVMVVAPLLQRYFFGDSPPGVIRQVLGETIAAHIVTIPIVVGAFGLISHVAIPANLLIVPLVPLAMLLTFITGIAGLILPAAAEVVGLPATWLLGYMTQTATILAELPWAQMEWVPPLWLWGVYIGTLVLACYWMKRVTGYRLRDVNPIV